jgi:hypothetical protein
VSALPVPATSPPETAHRFQQASFAVESFVKLAYIYISMNEEANMPSIKPVSDLRNYSEVLGYTDRKSCFSY